MDTQPGYPVPRHLTRNPSSQRGASHVGSQGEEAISVTHDTLPQVVKASVLYYKKIKAYVQVITGNLTSAATLRVDKLTE